MTNTQTRYTLLVIAVVLGLTLLTVIIKVNGQLDNSHQDSVILQKQIDELKKANIEQDNHMAKLQAEITALNKDIDTTQALQRTQAQAILSLKKKHQ